MMLVNDEPQTESDIRAAKRVACIAESMDIIRTLTSNDLMFVVCYLDDNICFTVNTRIANKVNHLLRGKYLLMEVDNNRDFEFQLNW